MRTNRPILALCVLATFATAHGALAAPAAAPPQGGGLLQKLPKRISLGKYTLPEGPTLTPKELALGVLSRGKLIALRALTMPAHLWPFNKIIQKIAHGEPFTGMTPKSAANVAIEVAKEGGAGVVVGRLSPSYRDIWTVREAEKSFAKLVDEIVLAKQLNPKVDASIAFDPDSFGLNLRGASREEGERIATDGMMRIARYAAKNGVPLEIDSIGSDALPVSMKIGEKIVSELKVPVRLALAARFGPTEEAVQKWADLGKLHGLKLGVRLVKGSYLEASNPDTINTKRLLIKQYKRVIHSALERSANLDVAIATQNATMWSYTRRTAEELGADYSMQVIRGVQPKLQAQMRKAGKISREYVSYGADAPIFGLTEALATMKEKRLLAQQQVKDVY